ncbi:MAG: MBL fold metallo-hydrolase [Treponema sp.]|nr:MBL fold metallo-hydrolase [Treponema sp.]
MQKSIDCVVVGDIQTNCWLYLLDESDEANGMKPCAVIDPGDEHEAIVSRLKELNWFPRYILLTHGHFDHITAVPGLLEACQNGAFGGQVIPLPKIGIHRQDAHYFGKDALAVHRSSFVSAGGSAAYVNALWKTLPDADIFFEEGETIAAFKILHVPGHTPGSSCFYHEKTGILFTGDTIFQGDYGRTDLAGGDWNLLCKSLKRLLAMPGETVICPGHGQISTVKDEAEYHNGEF